MAKIHATSVENLQVLIRSEEHAILADEPQGIGDGLGPDPYELLLAALGSCTVMTLQLYARRKGWALRKVDLELSHGRVHAKDCEDCEQNDGIVERIEVRLRLEGDLDAQQRERLADIATRCPVRKTLAAGPHVIDTVVVDTVIV
ncbi:MAG: OsmC family protein [Acidobacteria bacterium]|nr:OsmC family protein [Acidobacteriota bacterium]